MDDNHLEDTIALLDRTPAALDALLRGLPDRWTTGTEGADTWSVTEVIAHLIYGERTHWMPRVAVILERGSSGEFVPFDRLGHRAAHDLTHLHQISRIMAIQYREVVGPWTEYLGVMNCNGHSSPSKA